MKMTINYLMEIRLFYDRLEVHPLPPTVISLWFAMMHIANKSGWPEEISIPVSTLEVKSGLERRGVYRARSMLRDAGLVSFRERAGNQCAVYRLVPLEGLLYKYDTQSEPDDADCCTDPARSGSHNGGLLYGSVTQDVTQTRTEAEPCGADLSHSASHKEDSQCNSDTQNPDCCTDLSRSATPLDRQNISIDKEKEEMNNGGSGEKRKTTKSPKKRKTDFDLSFIGDPAWENLVRTWLDYKRSRNENYKSELSVKKFHTMLRNLSGDDVGIAGKIIDKSIANNWAGVFELSGRSGGTELAENPPRTGKPSSGQRIGQIKQPEDEERRRRLLEKFDRKK
ncbi:hypothetical protein LJC45_01735 [Alistipes sp. OttesenSCG-928-B03]|nr:hypothetical protein [Alistipes sp. OttesenSCG-928-B03]